MQNEFLHYMHFTEMIYLENCRFYNEKMFEEQVDFDHHVLEKIKEMRHNP